MHPFLLPQVKLDRFIVFMWWLESPPKVKVSRFLPYVVVEVTAKGKARRTHLSVLVEVVAKSEARKTHRLHVVVEVIPKSEDRQPHTSMFG